MAFTQLSTTQVEFLETYLRGTGRELSFPQARETFGIGNLRSRMTDLRQAGLRVRKSKNTNGYTTYSVSRRDVYGNEYNLYR
jgi:hypothetical protein